MKDSEFIELLNLYLDHEISAADAARLEAEVLQHPARRRVYQDYCRMQKACKVLAQDFVDEAAPANAKVIDFATERRASSRTGWIVAGTFAAAAACVAVVFVSMKRETTAAPLASHTPVREETVSIPAPRPATNAERALPRVVVVPNAVAARDNALVVPVTALSLTTDTAHTPERFVTSADPAAPQFAWMNAIQFSPVQRPSLEEFRFDRRNPTPVDTRMRAKPGENLPMVAPTWTK